MADYKVTDTELTSIANAIRAKGGTQGLLEFPTDFVSAIGNISGGGGETPIIPGTPLYSVYFSGAKDIALTNYAFDPFDTFEFIYKKTSANHGNWPLFLKVQGTNGKVYVQENRYSSRKVINVCYGDRYGYTNLYTGDGAISIGDDIDDMNSVKKFQLEVNTENGQLYFRYGLFSTENYNAYSDIVAPVSCSSVTVGYADAGNGLTNGILYLFPTSSDNYFNGMHFYNFIVRRNNEIIHEYIPFDNDGTLALEDLITNDIIETEIELASDSYTHDNYYYVGAVSSHEAVLIEKTVTENGTYDASDDEADGYSQVVVNVPASSGISKPTNAGVITSQNVIVDFNAQTLETFFGNDFLHDFDSLIGYLYVQWQMSSDIDSTKSYTCYIVGRETTASMKRLMGFAGAGEGSGYVPGIYSDSNGIVNTTLYNADVNTGIAATKFFAACVIIDRSNNQVRYALNSYRETKSANMYAWNKVSVNGQNGWYVGQMEIKHFALVEGADDASTVDTNISALMTLYNIPPKIVSWSSGTDAEIAAMVAALDDGSLSIADTGWSIGDERVVPLSAMAAITGGAEGHAAQNVTMVLMDSGHYDLTNGGKDHFVVGLKDCLDENGLWLIGDASDTFWKDCNRRTWLNESFKNSIPQTLRQIFKQFECQSVKSRSENELVTTDDYFSLFAAPEILGSSVTGVFSSEISGLSIIEYYKTASNVIKKSNNAAVQYWTRSESAIYENNYISIESNGTKGIRSANSGLGIAPFGCI